MKITALLPSTWSVSEAWQKLLGGSPAESSQGLSDLFILVTLYFGGLLLLLGLFLTFRSCWKTLRYRRRLKSIKDYSSVRGTLGSDGSFPLFREFNHHLVEVPKQDGSGELMLRRSVDGAEIFTDDRFAPGLSSNRLFQAAPGILTGLGVLGTFVGLQLGIGGLDLQDLKKLETSIVPLIQGCAVAFSTSVWGVTASLVFSLIEKLLEGFALGGVRKFQQRVDDLVPRYVPEEAMAELARSSRSSENLLKGLAVAIGDEMQKAIGRLGTEIKDAVVNATKEGQGPLAEQSAQLLSSAITAELGKLKEAIDGMGQRFTDDFSSVSSELTKQVQSFGPVITKLAESVATNDQTVSNAVAKLNAHESVIANMGEASDRIKQAAQSFEAMNGTLETSAARNKEAADAQHAAANVNQEVAAQFRAVGEHLPEVRQTVEDAARVIGSLGAPIAELQSLLAKQPELYQQLEGQRTASEEERSTRLLSLSKDLAGTVGKAVEEFAKVGAIAQQLDKASSSLEEASNELAVFGQQVLQASQEQRAASEASREAANASKQTTEVLKPLPTAFKDLSVSFAESGDKLRSGVVAATESQRLWLKGVESQLVAQRDQLKAIVESYGSQLEGSTRQLIDQWTKAVTDCLKSYDTQVETLNGSLEELQEAISSLKRKA
ncbi:MAG: anti-phage defense ZorAB system ZorA [Verrucomicrobiales bacterium]|nr:anti-phage defense ZorAB system ZorA [Verrucomicrobiales bacterium]